MSQLFTLSDSTRIVRKTADETVNNSATLQNDNHLAFAIGASETWFVEAFLQLSGASATADFKFGWTGPASASAAWGVYMSRGEAVAGGVWVASAAANTQQASATLADSVAMAGLSGATLAQISGFFTAAATAGTIQFQWAQNTQTAEDNKVLANSFLRLIRLA